MTEAGVISRVENKKTLIGAHGGHSQKQQQRQGLR